MAENKSLWQNMFYFSIAVLTIWLILKLTGVIQTPFWLEYGVPLASLIVGILSLYQNLMANINKLVAGFATLTVKFDQLTGQVNHLEQDVGLLKKNLERN